MIATVQRDGSYTLEEAEVKPADPGAPISYAMPQQVAEAIVRLEERNLQADEQFAAAQQESLTLQRTTVELQHTGVELQRTMVEIQRAMVGIQRTMLTMQQTMAETQRASLTAHQAMAQAVERIADRIDVLALGRPAPAGSFPVDPTTESVLADWRQRLSVTSDVWALAVVIVPVLVETGELRQPLDALAARTGLSVQRVNDGLRMLRKHACIHSRGGSEDGAPVYVLNRP